MDEYTNKIEEWLGTGLQSHFRIKWTRLFNLNRYAFRLLLHIFFFFCIIKFNRHFYIGISHAFLRENELGSVVYNMYENCVQLFFM